MSDLKPFKPTLQDVKDIIESYDVDGEPTTCTDKQAQDVLDNWNDALPDAFYEHVKYEFMEGETFNTEDDENDA